MTASGRKIRFELTPLEAEAAFAIIHQSVVKDSKEWNKFERKHAAGVGGPALARVAEKIRKEIKHS